MYEELPKIIEEKNSNQEKELIDQIIIENPGLNINNIRSILKRNPFQRDVVLAEGRRFTYSSFTRGNKGHDYDLECDTFRKFVDMTRSQHKGLLRYSDSYWEEYNGPSYHNPCKIILKYPIQEKLWGRR